MTQSSCKRDTKSKSHFSVKLLPVRVFSCKHPLSHPVSPRKLFGWFSKLPLFLIPLILPVAGQLTFVCQCQNHHETFVFNGQRRTWSFYVLVLLRTAKKCTKNYNACAQPLFCSLNLCLPSFPLPFRRDFL